jgi:two-component system, NarL family, sensor histidine kinase DesK
MAITDDIQIVEIAPPTGLWRAAVRPDSVATIADDHAFTRQEMRALVWLPIVPLIFLVYPIVWLIQTPPSPPQVAIAILGLCVFVALHLWNTARVIASAAAGSVPRSLWIALALQLALACGFGFAYGLPWFGLFIKTSGNIGLSLPIRTALRGIAGVAALTVITGLAGGWGVVGTAGMVAIDVAVGLVTLSVGHLLETNRQLRVAQAENAHLAVAKAVAEERLRFARDLHDLLGHSLSLIVLKSELAGRLQRVDAERATGEMRDVEGVAREALREVREAVAGYRQPTLATELPGARIMLAAAGIACDVDDGSGRWEVSSEPKGGDSPPTARCPLPTPIDAVLAWTVREGVTNVIRHSRARCCAIRVVRAGDAVSVEVTDDGVGGERWAVDRGDATRRPPFTAHCPPPTADRGSGIAGIAERAAALGGYCQAEPHAGGGFRLFVSLPLMSNEQ